MRRLLILSALLPLALAAYLLLAVALGRWLKANRDSSDHAPVCDCEACDPDASGPLR